MSHKLAASGFARRLIRLNALRSALGAEVFNYTLVTVNGKQEVTFTRHPTVGGDRPSLEALEQHVNGTRALVFDDPSVRVRRTMPWVILGHDPVLGSTPETSSPPAYPRGRHMP